MSDLADTNPDVATEAPDLLPDDAPRPTMRQSKLRWFAEVLLPPLVLGTVIVGFWYFVSYLMLDAEGNVWPSARHDTSASKRPAAATAPVSRLIRTILSSSR